MQGTYLSATVRCRKPINAELAEEAIECRSNGYILTGKFLGQGAYAKVYLGQAIPEKIQSNVKLQRICDRHKSVKVAIKIISTTSAPNVYITKFLPREVSTMGKCYRHTNVIQLYDIFATPKRIYLILEYAECGDLLSFVNRCYSKKSGVEYLSEDQARIMFSDILSGINFIHSRGVAHRDLKCENILLAKNQQAKLSDFGFAIEPDQNRDLLKTHCGSYAYAPPEILRQQKYDGKLADIWSLGVILFAMVNGGLPFKESDAKAVLAAMKKPVYFKNWLTEECKDLIRGLLKIRPQKRMSISEILSHSWMKPCRYRHLNMQERGDEIVENRPGNNFLPSRTKKGDVPTNVSSMEESSDHFSALRSPDAVLRHIMKTINLNSENNDKEVLEVNMDQNRPLKPLKFSFVPKSPKVCKESVQATPVVSVRKSENLVPNLRASASKSRQRKQSCSVNQNHQFQICSKQNSVKVSRSQLELRKIKTRKEFDHTSHRTSVETSRTEAEIFDPANKNISIRLENKQKVFASEGKKSQAKWRKENGLQYFREEKRRLSATPTVVNIGLSERDSANRNAKVDLEKLRMLSLYKIGMNRKSRAGAASVPPEMHENLFPFHQCTENKFSPKSKVVPCNEGRLAEAGDDCAFTTIQKLSSPAKQYHIKDLITINEDLEMSQLEPNDIKNRMLPPQIHTSKFPLKSKKPLLTPQNYNSLISHNDRNNFHLPKNRFSQSRNSKTEKISALSITFPSSKQPHMKASQATAAWMGQNCFTPLVKPDGSMNCVANPKFVKQNINEQSGEEGRVAFHRKLVTPNHDVKLLYKRRQTNKNTLNDSMRGNTPSLASNSKTKPSCNKELQSPNAKPHLAYCESRK